MKIYIQALALVWLVASGPNAMAAETMFPVPKAAYDVRHFVLTDAGTNEDAFKIRLAFPSDQVITHYRALFRDWFECSSKAGWESFANRANGKPEYIHQVIYHWVAKTNDKVVTVALRYVSPGAKPVKTPATDEQLAFVLLTEPVTSAKDEVERNGYVCVINKTHTAGMQNK